MYGYYQPYWNSTNELEHFGIKGMKCGIRRYQNTDGTLTEAGKKRLEKYKKKESDIVIRNKKTFEESIKRAASSMKKKGIIQDPKDAAADKAWLKRYDKELKGIMSMTYSDMKAEKVEAAKQYIRLFYQTPVAAMITTENKITEMRIDRYEKSKRK